MLGFRNADSGGFSVWPEKNASTWLSAIALTSLCAARGIILVEDTVIEGLMNFLISQQAQNGTFSEIKTTTTDVSWYERHMHQSTSCVNNNFLYYRVEPKEQMRR